MKNRSTFSLNITLAFMGVILVLIGTFGYPMVCNALNMDIDARYTFLINAVGIGMILYFAFHYSRFDLIFRKTGLGIDGVYPTKTKKVKTNNYTLYTFTLPAGLSTKIIGDKQQIIEEYFNADIEIFYNCKRSFCIKFSPRE